MDRLDQAATELIEQDIRGRFPADAGVSVAVLQYGDDPAVEPGQVMVRLTIEPPTAEGDEHPMEAFQRTHRETIEQLRKFNGCAAQGEPCGSNCTIYPSTKGAPVATFIHPFGHIYPPQVTPLIVKFFQDNPRRS